MPKDIHTQDTSQQRASRLLLAMGVIVLLGALAYFGLQRNSTNAESLGCQNAILHLWAAMQKSSLQPMRCSTAVPEFFLQSSCILLSKH